MNLIPFTLDNQNQPQIVYPMIYPTLPAPPVLPPLPMQLPQGEVLQNQTLPKQTKAPLVWNGSTWADGQFITCPSSFEVYNQKGERVPPLGYSFVLMDVPMSEFPNEEGGESCPPSPPLSATGGSSCPPSPQPGPEPSHQLLDHPEEKPVVPVEDEKQKNRKFRHRSKQERILKVHEELRVKYTAKGLYAGNDEVLRGFDTVRVHVKTFHALNEVYFPLEDVENHPRIEINRIATPFSMKNRFQKKGFIVYLKLKTPEMVPLVQEIFAKYEKHFPKCDLALKKEDKIAMQEAAKKAAVPKEEDPFEDPFTPFSWEMPAMAKRSSLQAA